MVGVGDDAANAREPPIHLIGAPPFPCFGPKSVAWGFLSNNSTADVDIRLSLRMKMMMMTANRR